MSDIKYSWYHSSKGFKILDGTNQQLLLADGSTTQINQPNGVAGLDANGQVANAQLPKRIKDKTLMIPGNDTGHFGFMDRNILWDACGRGTTTMNLTGAGTIGEGNLKTLFNGNGDFLYIYGVDNTTQLVVTTLYEWLS